MFSALLRKELVVDLAAVYFGNFNFAMLACMITLIYR